MKKILRILLPMLGVLVAAGTLVLVYRELREERDREQAGEAPVSAPSRAAVGPEGSIVRLDQETQTRLGVATSIPARAQLADELTATARVVDGTGMAAQLAELRTAQALIEASRLDFERKRKLAEQGQNTSASAVEAARAAFTRDEIAQALAQSKIGATWGPAVASRSDLPEFAEALRQREHALVVVELFAADALPKPPARATLVRLDGFTVAAELLGPAPGTDNPLAGDCLLYLVTQGAARLVPGNRLTARLSRGPEHAGWLVPRDAVVRHLGAGWIYIQRSGDTFVRRRIPLEEPHADGWLVRGEFTDPIVVAGAQSLLSEELKGQIQMKD